MHLGIVHFTGCSVLPDELAREVQDRGFESLFYTEHTHIPIISRRRDGNSARDYASTFDPFVALAVAAAASSTIQLGTAVCLLAQRDPIITAKEIATIDRVCAGRLVLGIGSGWNRPEAANHRIDPRTRRARMVEAVQAMRAIWREEQAEFHGEHVDFDPLWSWPKPVQDGGPPVLVGGNGPNAENLVLAVGDGWLPQCGHLASVDELASRVAILRQRAQATGRGYIPVTLFGVPYDPELLRQFASIGVDRCLAPVKSDRRDDTFVALDALTAIRKSLEVDH